MRSRNIWDLIVFDQQARETLVRLWFSSALVLISGWYLSCAGLMFREKFLLADRGGISIFNHLMAEHGE